MNPPIIIVVRPYLLAGGYGSKDGKPFIILADHLSRKEAEVTIWHELLHMLYCVGGNERPTTNEGKRQLEEEVEFTAQRLAKYCPEIVEILGLQEKFPLP